MTAGAWPWLLSTDLILIHICWVTLWFDLGPVGPSLGQHRVPAASRLHPSVPSAHRTSAACCIDLGQTEAYGVPSKSQLCLGLGAFFKSNKKVSKSVLIKSGLKESSVVWEVCMHNCIRIAFRLQCPRFLSLMF